MAAGRLVGARHFRGEARVCRGVTEPPGIGGQQIHRGESRGQSDRPARAVAPCDTVGIGGRQRRPQGEHRQASGQAALTMSSKTTSIPWSVRAAQLLARTGIGLSCDLDPDLAAQAADIAGGRIRLRIAVSGGSDGDALAALLTDMLAAPSPRGLADDAAAQGADIDLT